jgi:hypothetical protein
VRLHEAGVVNPRKKQAPVADREIDDFLAGERGQIVRGADPSLPASASSSTAARAA